LRRSKTTGEGGSASTVPLLLTGRRGKGKKDFLIPLENGKRKGSKRGEACFQLNREGREELLLLRLKKRKGSFFKQIMGKTRISHA